MCRTNLWVLIISPIWNIADPNIGILYDSLVNQYVHIGMLYDNLDIQYVHIGMIFHNVSLTILIYEKNFKNKNVCIYIFMHQTYGVQRNIYIALDSIRLVHAQTANIITLVSESVCSRFSFPTPRKLYNPSYLCIKYDNIGTWYDNCGITLLVCYMTISC